MPVDHATRSQLLAHLKQIKAGAKKAIELRAPLAQLVWKVRCAQTIIIDDVELPDWGGNGEEHRDFMKELFIAAGFVTTDDMTVEQVRLVREARKSFNDAIRYDLRKLADAELNRAQLLVSGFHFDPKLPDTQVLRPTDKRPARQEKLPPAETLLTTFCSQAVNLATKRAGDVRALPVMTRIETAKRVTQAVQALLAVINPTPAERKAAEQEVAERAELMNALQAMGEQAEVSKGAARKGAAKPAPAKPTTPAAKDGETAGK